MAAKCAIPAGYHSVTPYLVVVGADKVIEFMEKAFGATVNFKLDGPDGKIGHAEMQVGDSRIMLGEAHKEWKPMPSGIYLYVKDSDAVYKKALEAGAESVMEVADQFYGDRHGGVRDPAGNLWWISTRVEDVPDDEMKRRAEEWMKKNKCG
ncbi:MAG: VOC family protein [Alphaproteobacteria bacterium]